MAELNVKVVRIKEVIDHPDADRLEIIKFYGSDYVCVSQKGNYVPDDLAFYFPVDSVLPDEWVEEFGISGFYHNRIKAARLRGVFSEGLLIPTKKYWPKELTSAPYEGAEVSGWFGVTKYEAPIPQKLEGQVLAVIKDRDKFESPEHFKEYLDLFENGEEVVITEKYHGTNFSVKNEFGKIISGSHNNWFIDNEENKNNVYVRIVHENRELRSIPEKVQVYGEVLGVQDLKYGQKNGSIDYVLFAVKVDGRYLDYTDFQDFCNKYNLKRSNVLFKGPYSKEKVYSFNKADSTFPNAKHMMEGVIVQPAKERIPLSLNKRLVLKFISERYRLRKGGSENK